MRIWIDGYEANVAQRVGSGQVAFELIKNIEKIDRKNEYTVLLSSQPREDLPKERLGWHYKILKPSRLKTWLSIPWALFRANPKPDVIFTPTHYIPRFSKIKRVGTIFDLSYLYFPKMFTKDDLLKLTNWSKFSILNADKIITISNFTKKDILKNYSVESNKVVVSYPGFDKEVFKPVKDRQKIEKIQKKYGIKGNYIIYIGTIQPRKNLMRLMEAVSKIDDLKLVIVGKTRGEGKQGWLFEETLRKPRELGIEDRVIFTGFVPTVDLPALLCGALAYVQPSLWEGFGIPPVEAMACGVPVIVSNISSLPEVVGKSGLLVKPTSVDQIEQAIRTVLADKKLRIKLSKLGIERVKKFSWKKMAKIVIKTLEEVAVK